MIATRQDEDKKKDQLINELVELRQRITELEALENQLKHELEEFKEWIDTFDTFVGRLDPNGTLIFCNKSPLEAGGLTKDEVYGKYFPDTKWWSHSETERVKIVESLRKAKAGLSSRVECTFRRANGTPIPIVFNCQPVMDEEGNVKYITAEGKVIIEETRLRIELQEAKENLEKRVRKRTAEMAEVNEKLREEIAKRRRLEENLKDRVQALEMKTKELEDFTFIVSHDLKEPLRGIASFSQFVLEDYADRLDEKGRGYLLTIRKGAERMKRLIDDLLALSKVTRIEVPFQLNRASEIIEEAVKPLKHSIDEKDIELTIPQDLPTIYCDKVRMIQVFENLLSNAIKFMDKENPKIEIGYQDKVDHDQFYIRDNGMGIEKQYHDKIFGMFERLHRREDYDGTGAGLHIVKKIIEMHRGKIWVESEKGIGSTFYFTLPKREEEK